jgi:hypothetical protein
VTTFACVADATASAERSMPSRSTAPLATVSERIMREYVRRRRSITAMRSKEMLAPSDSRLNRSGDTSNRADDS